MATPKHRCLSRRSGWAIHPNLVTGLAETPLPPAVLPPAGQSPTLPHLVTQEEAKKDERNDDSSGQRLPSASTCLHAAILAASLGHVDRRALNCNSVSIVGAR